MTHNHEFPHWTFSWKKKLLAQRKVHSLKRKKSRVDDDDHDSSLYYDNHIASLGIILYLISLFFSLFIFLIFLLSIFMDSKF